jgi:hypothetical protein
MHVKRKNCFENYHCRTSLDLLAGNDKGLYRTSATTIRNLLPILNLDSVNRCLGAIEGAITRVESKETADILNSTQKALVRRKL